MTDETGKNDVTKPAADAAPKPSRRQIAMLGAAAPVLMTLPIKGARATGYGGGDEHCGGCSMSTFSAALHNEYDYPRTTKYKSYEWEKIGGSGSNTKWQRQYYNYNNNYSCVSGDAVKHKVFSHKEGWGDVKTQRNKPS